VAAACGGSGKATSASRTTTTLAPTTSTTLDVNSKILADLQAQFDTFARLAAAPNPDDPAIAQYATDPLLRTFRAAQADLLRKGQVVKGSSDHHTRVVSVQGSTALVDDCATGGERVRLYDAKTGQDLGPAGSTTPSGSEITMRLEGGTWKDAGANDKPSACP
jgi:hypothetical protein